MSTLLFEIGCEELPASACREAAKQLRSRCEQLLHVEPEVYVTPRRLSVLVAKLPDRVGDELRRGPSESVAFDAAGAPTQAASGFARAQGVALGELERADGYVWARIPGVEIREKLPSLLEQLARGVVFGKSMRWTTGEFRFARPVRWLCAKLDAETIPVELEGIRSGGSSYGHRFTHGEVEIASASSYLGSLRAAGVEPDQDVRLDAIRQGLDALGPWSDPLGKLEEVVYLVESPSVHEGSFDERFLALPERVIVTAMQSHQRSFPLGGNRFAFVANGGDPTVVRPGNERVLGARLEDASFTFERDVAKGIERLAASLPAITFAAGAGSLADKSERLVALVEALGGGEASLEAARLAKADQAAELVREFPDLEGAIGAEYARLAGYPEAVCRAIEEHYLPDSAEGKLPTTEAGRVLAVADRIDNLAVAFALGQRPSGTRDPYGLRRAAIGLCRLALEGLHVELGRLVDLDAQLLTRQNAEISHSTAEVEQFVFERLEGLLDVPVEFVWAARGGFARELGSVGRLARALAAAAGSQEFALAYTVYERTTRITAKANGAAAALDPRLAVEEAETVLIQALAEHGPQIGSAMEAEEYEAALAAAARLAPTVDRFFEDVLVMAEDSSLRANRLRLLLDVRETLGALGDLTQIPR